MLNPFLILPIEFAASQTDILQQVTKALRSGKHNAKQIADAQRILFDPLARATAEFRYLLNIPTLSESKSLELESINAIIDKQVLSLQDPFTER